MQAVAKRLHTWWHHPHFVNMAARKPTLSATIGRGYAAYGFCIHRWHTAVPHNGVEELSHAAVCKMAIHTSFEKVTMFGRSPDVACR